MKEVYNNLCKNLSEMTENDKQKEWEDLKEMNDIGPSLSDIIHISSNKEPNH